jgi:transposase
MSEPADVSTVATRPTRCRAAAHAAWTERLARFPASGLTPAQFCAQQGVSLPSFYAWRRRLAAQAAATEPGSDDAPGPRLLPVRLPPTNAAVELVLPSGAVLRLAPGCDLAFVRALLQALGGAPC